MADTDLTHPEELHQFRRELRNKMIALMVKISGMRQAINTPPSRLIPESEPLPHIRDQLLALQQEIRLWSDSCSNLIDKTLAEIDAYQPKSFTSVKEEKSNPAIQKSFQAAVTPAQESTSWPKKLISFLWE